MIFNVAVTSATKQCTSIPCVLRILMVDEYALQVFFVLCSPCPFVNAAAVSIAHTVTIAGSTFAVAIAVGTTESSAT